MLYPNERSNSGQEVQGGVDLNSNSCFRFQDIGPGVHFRNKLWTPASLGISTECFRVLLDPNIRSLSLPEEVKPGCAVPDGTYRYTRLTRSCVHLRQTRPPFVPSPLFIELSLTAIARTSHTHFAAPII